MSNRILAIGDIHGALKALDQILDRAQVTTNDTLVFLGDYVDGWGQSAQVIEKLIELQHQHHCIFIKGNHDVWCLTWLKTGKIERVWFEHGGKMTIASYKNDENEIDEAMREKHIRFFESMYNYFIDGNNRLFIHAGFSSMHGPEKEVYESNYTWDRTLWETALAIGTRNNIKDEFYPQRLKLFSEMFIGHTPTTNYGIKVPMQAANLWNLDTGAAFIGKLSIMDIQTKQYWQSDEVRTLYPSERGRNKTSLEETI